MNPLIWFSSEASAALCLTLVHSLWQVSLAVALLWCIGRLARRLSVERLYALYVAGLVVCLAALPVTYAMLYSPPTSAPNETAPVEATDNAVESSAAPVGGVTPVEP